MIKRLHISIIFLVFPFSSWSQGSVDSTQENEIRYTYEKVYSEAEFESAKNQQLKRAESNRDSSIIMVQFKELQESQKEQLVKDTLQLCYIVFVGEPVEFKVVLGDEELYFNQSDFSEVRYFDCYWRTESQCKMAVFKRTDKIIEAEFESKDLNFACNLDLSFSKIKIKNSLNIPLSEITTELDPAGGPPIPKETMVLSKGGIEIHHTWSK